MSGPISVSMDFGTVVVATISPCNALKSNDMDATSWWAVILETPIEVMAERFWEGLTKRDNKPCQYYKIYIEEWGEWWQFPADAITIVLVNQYSSMSSLGVDEFSMDQLTIIDADFNLRRYVKQVVAAKREGGGKKVATWPLHEYSRT